MTIAGKSVEHISTSQAARHLRRICDDQKPWKFIELVFQRLAKLRRDCSEEPKFTMSEFSGSSCITEE